MKKEQFQELPETEQEWVDAYLSGTISKESFEELQTRMIESPKLRSVMRRYLALDTTLHAQAGGESSPWLEQQKAQRPKNLLRFLPIAAAAAVAFLLGLGLMHLGNPSAKDVTLSDSAPPVTDLSPQAEGFAVVDGVFDVTWANQQVGLTEGDVLGAETLHLASGTLAIKFFSGAMMTLEGPAEISLKSAWEASCLEGSVRMRVPPAARGFKLNSPSTEIIDLGTEFGLEVRNGKGHVEVFDGEIALTHQGEKEQILKKGSAIGLERNGPSTSVTAGQVAFPNAESLRPQAAKELSTGFLAWQKHRDSLANNKDLIAYYTFDQKNSGSLIPNLTLPRNPDLDGAVILAEPVSGRWPGLKSAFEFRRPGSRIRVNIPGEFSALTFSCWVRIDSLDRRYNALFMGDGYENGEPHWQIRNDGKLMLSIMVDQDGRHPIYPEKSRFHHVYLSPSIWDLSLSGQWVHIASVYDPHNELVSHSINGEQVSQEKIHESFLVKTLRIGNGEICNWGQPFRQDPNFTIRNLNGRMDELAIFKTALSQKQISSLYLNSR
ncbi:FecR domain-containing protein, partial [Akkermansiaceae bacterium]|nr:FecR domain-containing protein [Akkermansiaceae bacterium]